MSVKKDLMVDVTSQMLIMSFVPLSLALTFKLNQIPLNSNQIQAHIYF
jgi:hypothetical protein